MNTWFPWLISLVSGIAVYMQGQKDWRGWALGLVNNGLWLAFAIGTQAWGLLPMNLLYWWLFSRNLRAWRADENS